ncbi:hypothetical protein CVT25_007008 [Psilocybe cyanescens]|uniref:Uncharacterized protein n=1 Tax=Psilocybe cyanescens TaxID=93625 RepID=A0A409WYE6_PSICY|nr:hypothetical protein CVT25_007008 [Psilocybe cyanescens]
MSIYLLSQSNLLVIMDGSLVLSDYSICPDTTSLPPESTIFPYLWSEYFGPELTYNVSRLYFTSDKAIILLTAGKHVYSVNIEDTSSSTNPLSIVKLAVAPSIFLRGRGFLGYHHSVAASLAKRDITSIDYAHVAEKASEPTTLSHTRLLSERPPSGYKPADGDEETGRIIPPASMGSRNRDKMYVNVVDLALIFKS